MKKYEYLDSDKQVKLSQLLEERHTGFGFNLDERKLAHLDLKTVYESVGNLISLVGDDKDRDGLRDTPYRFIKAMLEYTEGYGENPDDHLDVQFDGDGHDEMVIVDNIPFYSMCEHHFAPFHGVAHIGYIPSDGKITGLSKFGRLLDGYAKRFQVQERLTTQIADAINNRLEPKGVMVVIEATHMCMCSRGVKKSGSSTKTSAVRGLFLNEANTRQEFLSLIK